jgi:hypothetical protein
MGTRSHRRTGRRILVGLAMLAGLGPGLACGSRRDDKSAHPPPDDARARVSEVPVPLPPVSPLPLGKPTLADFTYNRGPESAALERALLAETAGQWLQAGAAAAEVLAAVPGNLEAAWILALMRARQGQLDGVLEPLSMAVAGDWLRWGERSLRDPVLAGFHASAHGPRYRELAEVYDEQFRQALAENVLIVGRRGTPRYPARPGTVQVNHRSEIYAYDTEGGRYVRASRTDGSLVGYVRAPTGASLLYASYRRVRSPAPGSAALPALVDVRVGGMDLAQGRALGEVVFEDVARIEIGYRSKAARPGAGPNVALAEHVPVARVQTAEGGAWRLYALDLAAGVARPLDPGRPDRTAPAGTAQTAPGAGEAADAALPAPRLIVGAGTVHLDRLPVDDVMADWDDAGTAGAFRIARTRKTVTLAAGESVDGHSMAWSSTRVRLAFATAPLDRCAASAESRRVTLYTVDATTGALDAVATGEGDFAPMWLDDTRLAYMQEASAAPGAAASTALGAPVVTIVDVSTGAVVARLEGPAGVGTTHLPRHQCPAPGAAPDAAIDAGPAALPADAGPP